MIPTKRLRRSPQGAPPADRRSRIRGVRSERFFGFAHVAAIGAAQC
jgi:hypothetical protein